MELIILKIVGGVATLMVVYVLALISQKTGIEISVAKRREIIDLALDATYYVAEVAAKRIKYDKRDLMTPKDKENLGVFYMTQRKKNLMAGDAKSAMSVAMGISPTEGASTDKYEQAPDENMKEAK